jgi:indole-3-glycerol phosphate synthase
MKSIYKPIVKVTDSSYLDQKQIKKLAEHIQAFLVAETKARR